MSNYDIEIQKVLEQHKNLKISAREMTIKEWFNVYLSNYCIDLKCNTKASYVQAINNHINRVLGNVLLQDICPELLQYFVNVLHTGDEYKALSPKTVKNIYGVLHKGLTIAQRLGYITDKVSDYTIVLPKVIRPLIKPLSNEEVCAVLKYNKSSKYYLILITALFTGLRQSELLGLLWGDIDFDNGIITVSRQLIRNKTTQKYMFAPTKNGEPRTICPTHYLMDELKGA